MSLAYKYSKSAPSRKVQKFKSALDFNIFSSLCILGCSKSFLREKKISMVNHFIEEGKNATKVMIR